MKVVETLVDDCCVAVQGLRCVIVFRSNGFLGCFRINSLFKFRRLRVPTVILASAAGVF